MAIDEEEGGGLGNEVRDRGCARSHKGAKNMEVVAFLKKLW